MSQVLINNYYNQLEKAIRFSKNTNEETVKSYFWMLLLAYADRHDFIVSREVFVKGTFGKPVRPDGVLQNRLGINIGLWESKDEKDSLDDEIDAKRKKGYPFTNILFEDTREAVLIQNNLEVSRVPVRDKDKLHGLINAWLEYKSETVHRFEDAIERFKEDIPDITDTLRNSIDRASDTHPDFIRQREIFYELCRAEINPEITLDDIREMIIQHIMTADLFQKVFDEPDFHRDNNIARELEKLSETLYSRTERKNLLRQVEHYYETINSAAADIVDHHQKQKFLKVLYETFYKVYNPKAADRLGVVYTPNEIVQFMIQGTDYLLHKHFGKTLADKGVDIMDPATGTGTFICDIIDYIPAKDLAHKYKNEIHANEVAILPYYVANLNIEFTFKQKMDYYEEFPGICLVDTLDNMGFEFAGKQTQLFGLSSENSSRIKRQNEKKISVIIGNPPYNARQENYNYQNANRTYKVIDDRIKHTYIRQGTAQNQIVVYDMYTRFYRWAMDRIDRNGVIAFITNRSFIDSRAFDGFRKTIQDEFSYCYILDTRSDVRANPKIAGTTHNVFGIQTGVAIMFLVKQEGKKAGCQIYYHSLVEEWRKEIKLEWLKNNRLQDIAFTHISPDKKNNWLNHSDNDFEELLPLIDKDVKAGKSNEALFELFSLGVASHRDEWVYDLDKTKLKNKITFLLDVYEKTSKDFSHTQKSQISWDSDLESYAKRKIQIKFNSESIRSSMYRPFVHRFHYFDRYLNSRLYQFESIVGNSFQEQLIAISREGNTKPFHCLATDLVVDLHTTGDSQCLPLYRYDKEGNRIDNITDWGLQQFHYHYKDKKIKKEDIFHYTYAVLHNPAYRKKYERNLKREFPRLPFYDDFHKWAAWGKKLMDLHINYESAKPFKLEVVTAADPEKGKGVQEPMFNEVKEPEPMFAYKTKVKTKLKADKEAGTIELDELTTLKGIPQEAWEYKLGNRSALEWILDQYKEKKPKDPTIAEKFNTYRFADYKDKVIDLLKRVTTVSVETVAVVREMEEEG